MSAETQSDAPLIEAKEIVEDYLHRRRPYWRHKLVDKLAQLLLGRRLLLALITVHLDQKKTLASLQASSRRQHLRVVLYNRQRDECLRDLYGTTDDWSVEQLKFLAGRFEEEFEELSRTRELPPYQGPEEYWPERPWCG